MKATQSQTKATAAFHRRAERVYRQLGKISQAEAARKLAEKMEASLRMAS